MKQSYLTTAQLISAYWSHKPVSVWQHDQIIDYGGLIDRITPRSLRINDVHYIRNQFDFRQKE
jgi:hypothetical protein